MILVLILTGIATAQADLPEFPLAPEPTPSGPVMPNLQGRSLKDAETHLKKAGIKEYQVLEAPTREGVGTVVRQSPAAGTRIDPGSFRPKLYRGVPYREPQAVKASPPPPPANPQRELDWKLPLLIVQVGVVLALLFILPLIRDYLRRTAPAETRAPTIQVRNRQGDD